METIEKLGQEVKQGLTALETKIASQGKETAETKEMLSKVATVVQEFEGYRATQEAKAKMDAETLAILQKAMAQRPADANSPRVEKKALHDALCTAFMESKSSDESIYKLYEQKARTATDGQAGGFLITEDLLIEYLVSNAKSVNPMLQEATILTRGLANGVRVPKKLLINGAKAAGELQKGGRTKRDLSMVTVNMNRYYSDEPVTLELLTAQSFETESTMVNDIMTDLGWTIQYDMLNGDGASKPAGLLKEKFLLDTAFTSTAASGKLTWTDLFGVRKNFNYEKYRANGKYFFNFNVFCEFLTEKDTQGRPIYMPGINGDQTSTIAGRPFVIMPDMAATIAANVPVVLYGDMKAAYIGVMNGEYKTYRDEITRKAEGVLEIGIATFAGGCVKDEEAIRAIKGA